MFGMRRREFITLLGGAASAWSANARAQQEHERVRRIGMLATLAVDDPESVTRHTAFQEKLQELGWGVGHNLRIDTRWGARDAAGIRKNAAELVALAPDVIVATGSPSVGALQQATSTIPIVFVSVVDPVGAGFVASLARPAGNTTGFTPHEYGMSAKWLELLKEIAPRVTRAAVLRDPASPAGIGLLAAMQGVAPSLGVELWPVGVRDVGEIERAVAAFARESNGGLIVTSTGLTIVHRGLISALPARHKLPAVYFQCIFVTSGGLISYGDTSIDSYRRAAGYVDRILRGEKPADLPVQAPTNREVTRPRRAAVARRPRRRGD
jgi:putative tryptophan/tyrosine transport system substrate-binding protein